MTVGSTPQAESVPRFSRNYLNRYVPDFALREDEAGMVTDLFRCHECFSLTADPLLHDQWHERTTPPGTTQGGEGR